jgi:hypothetical protein
MYQFYHEVVNRGGLDKVRCGEHFSYRKSSPANATQVIEGRAWTPIIGVLRLPASCTNAAYVLRINYLKFLYCYERVHFFSWAYIFV